MSFIPNALVQWGVAQEIEFRALVDHLGGMGALFLSIVGLSALLCGLAGLLVRWYPRTLTERYSEVAGVSRGDPINHIVHNPPRPSTWDSPIGG